MQSIKTNIKKYILIVLLSILFLLVFSDDTSPLAKYWFGADSSLYMLFGKALNHGLLPYRDVFDHKGPYFFFLQQIGQFFWEGKNGAFIIQIINLSVVLIYSYKIYSSVNDKLNIKYKNLYLFPILWVLAGTLEGGNTNEEFSLSFSIISLYLFIKYLDGCDKRLFKHNPINAFIFGIFFGFIVFSRANNSGFLCSIILAILIILIVNKEYRNIFCNIAMFIFGVIVAIIPILYFYYSNGILKEMLYSCFVFAFQYSTNISLFARIRNYVFGITFLYIVPIILAFIVMLSCKRANRRELLFAVISSIAACVATFVGYNYYHYYILTVPNIVFLTYIFIKYYDSIQVIIKKKVIVSTMAIVLIGQSYRVGLDFANSMVHIFDVNITYRKVGYYKYYTEQSKDIVSKIPKDDFDSIWGHGIGSEFYMRTNIYPCIKYYDFVDMYFDENLGDVKNEIMFLLNNKSPKWIVIKKKERTVPIEIQIIIEQDYHLYYENEEFSLYSFNKQV